jgi:hypothetical protein
MSVHYSSTPPSINLVLRSGAVGRDRKLERLGAEHEHGRTRGR